MLYHVLDWLRSPWKARPADVPDAFRWGVSIYYVDTDVYESAVTTGAHLMSGERTYKPYLVHHHFRFTYRGQEYRMTMNDKALRPNIFKSGSRFPAYLNGQIPNRVFFMGQEHKCQPWIEDDENEDEIDGPLMAVDVHYAKDGRAVAAAVLFDSWHQAEPTDTISTHVGKTEPYESGAFYKRELPCILALIETMKVPPCAVIIDGYVTLGADQRDGLGMHLYRALDKKVTVLGVAKKRFEDTPEETELLRGSSTQPLFVTAAGMSQEGALNTIKAMHGPHRMPTMLQLTDRLCRDELAKWVT